jgi:hypothetical protein
VVRWAGERAWSLDEELEQIIRCTNVEEAMLLAETARASSSPTWNDQAWLTIATCANGRAISDPAWFALCIFAHEQRSADVAVVDALVKRARIIVEQGPTDGDLYRDPDRFFAGIRGFIGSDSSPAALEAFQVAMNVVFTAARRSSEWAAARVKFIRSRRLREIGQALRAVADRGVVVPPDLAEWLVWAAVRAVDGRVVT